MPDQFQIVGQETGDSHDPMRVDNTADHDAGVVIDAIHARIHRGQLFEHDEVNAALASAGTIELLLIVTTAAHLRFHAAVGGDTRVQLYEGTTVSANGTQRTPLNRNRFSSKTPVTEVYFSPTITTDGSLISDQFSPGGTGPLSAGGESGTWEEWVLNPGNYLLRATNISGATTFVHLEVDWYEDV